MNTLVLTRPRAVDASWRDRVCQMWRQIAAWRERARQRRQLAALQDWQLRDIGVSRAAARAEAAKPFWEL